MASFAFNIFLDLLKLPNSFVKKEMQSELYKKKQDKKSKVWLQQDSAPRKTSALLSMMEQIIEIRAWKKVRGLNKNSECRLFREQRETVRYLLVGWKMATSHGSLARHNRALMEMAVALVKEQNLLDQNVKWHQEKWKRGHVLENSQAKLIWDFEFNLQKKTTYRRPDLVLQEKQTKTISICDMAWPQEKSIEKKRLPTTGNLHWR